MKRVRIGISRIDGEGLFAAIDIKQGIRIIRYIGEKITKHESDRRLAENNAYIFELNDRYALDGQSLKNIARYINHSCEPNCEVQMINNTVWIVASKDIQEGEELTYDYGYEQENYQNYPCNCGAKNCCGYILARQYRGLIRRQGR
jgi:SET domain-containing protein